MHLLQLPFIALLPSLALLSSLLQVASAKMDLVQPGQDQFVDLDQSVIQDPTSVMCSNSSVMIYQSLTNGSWASTPYSLFLSCSNTQNLVSGNPVLSDMGFCPNNTFAIGMKVSNLSSTVISSPSYDLSYWNYQTSMSFQRNEIQFICMALFPSKLLVVNTYSFPTMEASMCAGQTDAIQSYYRNITTCASLGAPYFYPAVGLCPSGISSTDGSSVQCYANAVYGSSTNFPYSSTAGAMMDVTLQASFLRYSIIVKSGYAFCGVQKNNDFIKANNYSPKNFMADIFNGALIPLYCPMTTGGVGFMSAKANVTSSNVDMPVNCPPNQILSAFKYYYDKNNVITAYSYNCDLNPSVDNRVFFPAAVPLPNEPFSLMSDKMKTVFDVFSAGTASGLRIIMNGPKAPPLDPSNQLWIVNNTDAYGCSILQNVKSNKFLSCSANGCNQTDITFADRFRMQNETAVTSGSTIYVVSKFAKCDGSVLRYMSTTNFTISNYFEPRINGTMDDGVNWLAMPGAPFPNQAFYISNSGGLVIGGNDSLSLGVNSTSTNQIFVSGNRDMNGCSFLQSANSNKYLNCISSCTRVADINMATRFRRHVDTGSITLCDFGSYLASTNNTLYVTQSVQQPWKFTAASQALINQAATEKLQS